MTWGKSNKNSTISSQSAHVYRELIFLLRPCKSLFTLPIRRLEAEINEKLQDVHNKLLQAGVDQKESEREAKLKETLSNLQRIFPGIYHFAQNGRSKLNI